MPVLYLSSPRSGLLYSTTIDGFVYQILNEKKNKKKKNASGHAVVCGCVGAITFGTYKYVTFLEVLALLIPPPPPPTASSL
jgi:hypothetical protein